jgi:hypothetical protein
MSIDWISTYVGLVTGITVKALRPRPRLSQNPQRFRRRTFATLYTDSGWNG